MRETVFQSSSSTWWEFPSVFECISDSRFSRDSNRDSIRRKNKSVSEEVESSSEMPMLKQKQVLDINYRNTFSDFLKLRDKKKL